MSSDDNNRSSSTGGDQLLLSSSTGRLFDMNSSTPPAPTERRNMMHLADEATAAEAVSADEVAIIFGYLPHQDIMRARVCSTWRDAAKKTLVPLYDFRVDSVRSFNAMRVMTAALPNLQQISICSLGRGHKFSDGEDPNEELARRTAHVPTQDINIISNFTKLRVLHINNALLLNGRHPALFDFPLLVKLSIRYCDHLKFDLDILEGLPLLKELNLVCDKNPHFTGNLKSLSVLKDTLEKVEIDDRLKIKGDFMDLADFPRLKELNLRDTKVTGDIRNIGEDDFLALKSLLLPKSVRGGMDYQFQSISDVPSFMHTIHVLLQRTPTLFKRSDRDLSDAFGWRLSEDSPDWYGGGPFYLQFIREGSRLGWSWYYGCRWTPRDERYSCETNWLDTEPSREGSSDYKTYIEELQRIIEELACPIDYYMDFYRGYYEPPTVEEYRRLCEGRWDTF